MDEGKRDNVKSDQIIYATPLHIISKLDVVNHNFPLELQKYFRSCWWQ